MAIHVINPARRHRANTAPNTAPMISGNLSHLLALAEIIIHLKI